jgi:hypothetical protein
VKHSKQKIKLCWNIPSKDHCSFDKICINFFDTLFIASRPKGSLNDKPKLTIDDQVDLPIAIKIMLQMCRYLVRTIDKGVPDYVVDGRKKV